MILKEFLLKFVFQMLVFVKAGEESETITSDSKKKESYQSQEKDEGQLESKDFSDYDFDSEFQSQFESMSQLDDFRPYF